MKPERPLHAAGLAASHSDALFRQRAEEVDMLPEFDRLGERLARQLGPVFAALGGANAPEVRLTDVARTNGAELEGKIGKLAANCLLVAGKHRLLLSIDGTALLAQLDRAFGGTGEAGGKLPATLPLSADLLAQRVEQGAADVLSRLIDPTEPFRVAERDSCYATLAPFREGDALAALEFEVAEKGAKPMRLTLAATADSLAALLPSPEGRKRRPERKADPLDEPFGEITLTLEAVLSEMLVPLNRIAALAPGQVLPIPVARAVPLRIGGAIVARGTVGELEDRVALQITHTIHSRKDSQ